MMLMMLAKGPASSAYINGPRDFLKAYQNLSKHKIIKRFQKSESRTCGSKNSLQDHFKPLEAPLEIRCDLLNRE